MAKESWQFRQKTRFTHPMTVQKDGVAVDISGAPTIELYIFNEPNSPVRSLALGSGIEFTTDGSDGDLDADIDLDIAPGRYEAVAYIVDAAGAEEYFEVATVEVLYTPVT